MKVCKTCHNFFPDTMEVCPVDFCALEETDDELVGHVIGGCYRIISRLAEGGVGTVYFAKHQFFDRSVAIKVLKPMHLDNKDLRDRTLREARICGNVEHPNIVKVYDMVPQDRNLCVVMEYLQGETLKERLDRGEDLPEYFKRHPIYYAGPAKTPPGMPSGSFGPTTAGRMDSYVDLFQKEGASKIMIAKGNRSQQVTDACKKNGGFYLGSIGGPAAILAQESIRKVQVLDYPELGMEAIWEIEVENFPAFILIDDKGNDFFQQL